MLDRLHIEGFQSLENVDLPLGSFTVIQGKSNSGKSAVIRALRAVITNGGNLRGTGGSFITDGKSSCKVAVSEGENFLEWKKSASKTTYTLNGKVHTTGINIPEEVADFLLIGDLTIDKAASTKINVNFQGGDKGVGQFEPPFLVIGASGGYSAKVFSLLTSADKLYAAQSIARKEQKAHTAQVKALEEILIESEDRIIELRPEQERIHSMFTFVEALNEEASQKTPEISKLQALHTEYARCTLAEAAAVSSLARLKIVEVSNLETIEEAAHLHAHLLSSRSNLIDIEKALQQPVVPKLPDSVEDLCAQLEKTVALIETLSYYLVQTQKASSDIQISEQSISSEQENLESCEEELHTYFDSLDICEKCHQEVIPERVLV